jgi:hypothetical protein
MANRSAVPSERSATTRKSSWMPAGLEEQAKGWFYLAIRGYA